jgi:hypothetical protein
VLAVRPFGRVEAAVESVARLEAEAGHDDPGDPVEERFRALDLADAAHRVGDERPVAQPREGVRREGRRGDVTTLGRLARADDLDAPAPEVIQGRRSDHG